MDTATVTSPVQHFPATEATPVRSQSGRLGPRWLNQIKALLGTPSQRRLAQAALKVNAIRYWESEFSKLNDVELRQRGMQLRGRARGGESLERLLPEAFGLLPESQIFCRGRSLARS